MPYDSPPPWMRPGQLFRLLIFEIAPGAWLGQCLECADIRAQAADPHTVQDRLDQAIHEHRDDDSFEPADAYFQNLWSDTTCGVMRRMRQIFHTLN